MTNDVTLVPTRLRHTGITPAGEMPYPKDRHPAVSYLLRLNTPVSQDGMRRRLQAAAALLTNGRHDAMSCPWHALGYTQMLALRRTLMSRYAPRTVQTTLYAVRGVLKECWRLGYLTLEQYHRAIDIPKVRHHPLPSGRALEPDELAALFQSCAEDANCVLGARDGAVLACLYGCGLRVSEAAKLEVRDYTSATGALRIRQGKGGQDRLTYANAWVQERLSRWLACRPPWPGPLIVRMHVGGYASRSGLTTRGIWRIVHRRWAKAGVGPCTPHDLRRTFISTLLDAGVDLPSVQKLAGHQQMTTTGIYDRRPERAKMAAVLRLPPP